MAKFIIEIQQDMHLPRQTRASIEKKTRYVPANHRTPPQFKGEGLIYCGQRTIGIVTEELVNSGVIFRIVRRTYRKPEGEAVSKKMAVSRKIEKETFIDVTKKYANKKRESDNHKPAMTISGERELSLKNRYHDALNALPLPKRNAVDYVATRVTRALSSFTEVPLMPWNIVSTNKEENGDEFDASVFFSPLFAIDSQLGLMIGDTIHAWEQPEDFDPLQAEKLLDEEMFRCIADPPTLHSFTLLRLRK